MNTLHVGRTSAEPSRGLTVAVVHYQTPDVLVACLERVRASAPEARLVVLDAGDAQRLPSDWRGFGAELVRIGNHSYAHAVNVALRLTRTPFLAFMNADVYVRPDTLADLLHALRDPRVAATGPIARTADGTLQNQGLPYRWYQRRALAGGHGIDAPWLSGCLQVIRMAAVRGPRTPVAAGDGPRGGTPAVVGGMDATLRFYNEDIEWGWRMRRAGWTCRLVATPVVHLGGNATPPQEPSFLVEGLRGGYVLSQRYKPRWYRAAHRGAVMLGAAFMERFGDTRQRTAYRAVRRMFARGRFATSPFGATLADPDPAFWRDLT